MNPEAASALLGTWGYPLYVVLFLLTALGSPLTEDLLLLVGGYLIGAHVFSWPVTLGCAFSGVMGSDFLLYSFGRRLRAHSVRRGFVRLVIRPGRLRLAARWFSRYGQGVVFAARFLPGTRVIVFVSAGLRGMKPTRFLVLDGVAAAFWVPLVLAVGHWAGERIGGLGRTIEIVGDRVFWILAAVVGLHLARRWWLTRERRLVGDPDSEP